MSHKSFSVFMLALLLQFAASDCVRAQAQNSGPAQKINSQLSAQAGKLGELDSQANHVSAQAGKLVELDSQAKELQSKLDLLSTAVGWIIGVISLLTVFGLISSIFAMYSIKLQKEQSEKEITASKDQFNKSVEEFKKGLGERADEFNKSAEEFKKGLNERTKTLLESVPQQVEEAKRQLGLKKLLRLHNAVNKPSPLFSFYSELSAQERKIIEFEERRIPFLQLLSPKEDRAEFAELFWLLAIFYAGKVYTGGWFLEGEDLERSLLYFDKAIELDKQLLDAKNDKGAVLLAIKQEGKKGPVRADYLEKAAAVLSDAAENAKKMKPDQTVQRTVCNLAWAYLGLYQQNRDKYRDEIDHVLTQDLAGSLLEKPFRHIGDKPLPQMVHLVRSILLCQKGEQMEALAEFEKAYDPPSADVKRIILEETGEGRDLWPLLQDPETKAKMEALTKLVHESQDEYFSRTAVAKTSA
jgi:tetratricopeptide (TPR) repeat protein